MLVGLSRENDAGPDPLGAFAAEPVARITAGLSRCLRRERPGKSYPRVSMEPKSKWMRRKAA